MMTIWLWVYEAEKATSYEHSFPNAKVVHMKEVIFMAYLGESQIASRIAVFRNIPDMVGRITAVLAAQA